MNRKEIVNSQDYKATKAALKWWHLLPEEQRKAVDIDVEPDILDAYAEGVIYGWNNPHWIPVEEELPKHKVENNGLITYEEVLVCLNDGYVTTDCYDDTRNKWLGYNGDVEYWMPTPKPPRKEE